MKGKHNPPHNWPADPAKPRPSRAELVARLKGENADQVLTLRVVEPDTTKAPYPAAFASSA